MLSYRFEQKDFNHFLIIIGGIYQLDNTAINLLNSFSDKWQELLWKVVAIKFQYPYLPTPPLMQDMTQGQFLSGV